MQFKIFSVLAVGDEQAEETLNHFLRSHRVVSVQRELLCRGHDAFWSFCVEYMLGVQGSEGGRAGRSRVDYKEVLSDAEFALFARLRDVRKHLAAAEAVPVYTVCTNEQLAEMARGRPASLADLKRIEGIGEAKADKYGEPLLSAIRDTGEHQNHEAGERTD